MIVLSINDGRSGDRVIEVDRTLTIGRRDVDVRIDDTLVSRVHARVVLRDGAGAVEDLGSTNGTFLNGMKVSGTEPLDDGDVIRVGGTDIEVHIEEPAEALSPVDSTAPLPAGTPSRATPRGAGLVAGSMVVIVGLIAAGFAFSGSERGDVDPEPRAANPPKTEGVSLCRKADRRTRDVRAARRSSLPRWGDEVRAARRVRTRLLAALVTTGTADEAPAFVGFFRRTDGALLQLQRALKERRRKAISRAASVLRRRALAERKVAIGAGMRSCGGIGL